MKKLVLLYILTLISAMATEISLCKHLLNRTSFGIDAEGLSSCLTDSSYDVTISRLLDILPIVDSHEKPSFAQYIIKPKKAFKYLNAKERMAFIKKHNKYEMKMKKWWIQKLLTTKRPFEERMVLFWHNHFTSSLKKVKQPSLIYQQNQLFRAHALGNFSELLHAIIEDPAMLIYLDNRANKKSHPNENFARELLELFTMGEGNYNEKDIKEFARALTGYSVDKDFNFHFKKKIHDNGKKEIFGKTGDFNAHDIIDIILEQPATSRFIVRKIWLAFVGYTPNSLEVERLALLFRKNNYDIKPLMHAIFMSESFMSPSNYGTMIKSPIELIVGTLRSFKYDDFDARTGVKFCKRLGQDLLDPPNVKGWTGGKNWINTNTLLIRKAFLNRLTRGDTMKHLKYDLFQSSKDKVNKEERAVEILLPLKTFITPAPRFNQTLRTILQHPLYQLK